MPARARAAALPGAIGLIVVAALGMRLLGLDGKSLWFDEAYSVFIGDQPLSQIFRLLRAYDTHPPLHYLLLHFWMPVYGYHEAAVRLPSVMASLGVIFLTFLMGRRLRGDRLGLVAAALLAVSPFQVVASQEARMYPFLALFAAGASYALWLGLEEGRRHHWIAYAALIVLGLYTHHFAGLIVVAHAAYVVAFRRRAGLAAWVRWMIPVAVAYLPLAPLILAQLTSARAWPDFRAPFGVRALVDLFGMFSFGGGLFGMGTYFGRGTLPFVYQGPVLLPFLLLMVGGVAYLGGWRRRAFVLGYWLVPVLAVSAISLRWNMFYERYFSFVLPPFALLVAGGVLYLVEAVPRRARIPVCAGVVALLASFLAPALVDTYRAKAAYDWRGLAVYVSVKSRPDDFILYVPAFARIPFEYYYKGDQQRDGFNPTFKIEDQTATYSTKNGREMFARIARSHPRMWIIATIPLGYQVRLEIAEQLKPYFREVDGTSLGLAYAFLWESRVYHAPRGAPRP